jgi:uncharacterized protein (DUF1330 family)
MSPFLIAQVQVADDTRIPDYAKQVRDIVHCHGGKYLTRSGWISTRFRISGVRN